MTNSTPSNPAPTEGVEPEHADFNTDGHMHICLYDKHDKESECTEDCAAWLYALWTKTMERKPKLGVEPVSEVDMILEGFEVIETNHLYHHEHDKDKLKAAIERLIAEARLDEQELIERFRKALMKEHHQNWTMEVISEAAHICARSLNE